MLSIRVTPVSVNISIKRCSKRKKKYLLIGILTLMGVTHIEGILYKKRDLSDTRLWNALIYLGTVLNGCLQAEECRILFHVCMYERVNSYVCANKLKVNLHSVSKKSTSCRRERETIITYERTSHPYGFVADLSQMTWTTLTLRPTSHTNQWL